MTLFVPASGYIGALAAAITSSQTTITVTSADGLPSVPSGSVVPLTLLHPATLGVIEVVWVSAISGNTLTVARGADGTTALAWDAGDTIFFSPTSAMQNNWAQLPQVRRVPPVGASNSASATSVSATTGTLTAPSGGYFIAQYFMAQTTPSIGAQLYSTTASLGQPQMVSSMNNLNEAAAISTGYLEVDAGQSSTFTGTVTAGSAQWIAVSVLAWFVPSP